MKKIIFILCFLLSANSFVFSQKSVWSNTSQEKIGNALKMERETFPSNYQLFSLDLNAFKAQLSLAPLDSSNELSSVILPFPTPDGKLKSYRVYESPIMEKDLADKYPDIKTYSAIGIDDATASMRISVTLFGVHIMSRTSQHGTYYIDTYTKDLNNYIVYSRKNIQKARTFGCLVQDNPEELSKALESANTSSLIGDGIFRTYRLAMACTIEYAAFHVNAAGVGSGTLAQKKAAVLSAMVVTMNRVNEVYEKDMSLRMVLVANNDAVIFIDSDNFSNDDANALINESQTVIDTNIGSSNYDIGHTVSTGGGGLAQLNVPCTGSKARGITGSPAPVGDPYDIDYVAHEMGHQYGATHTFNNSCSGNRSASTAVEPGSGSTIMAYAGICAPNVQGNSDDHFHAVSIAQMTTFVQGTGTCSVNVSNGNNAPVVNAGVDYTIAKGTPFILTGSATDANGDALTYCWEQTNTGLSTNMATSTSTSGPNYRSFSPTTSPSRWLPRIEDVLANNLVPTFEVTPSVARTLNFALTVRDNRTPNGGQTARDNMNVVISGTAGPFDVTSQNTDGIVWTPGNTETITWTVNGTTALVGSTNVDILLSTDGGYTYNTVLLANTPNDGSQAITVPNVSASNCRVMVKPTGNIYYDINTKNIAIGNYTYETQTVCEDYVFNLNAAITESSDNSYPGYSLPISDSYTITDIKTYANVTHPKIGDVNILFWFPWSTGLNTAVWYNQTTCTNADMDKWFDLAGSAATCATVGGSPFLPYSATNFNGAIGQNSAGDWRIYFKDITVDSSGGVLNTFTIQLCRLESVPVLANESFGIEDFVIYPNPNNGNFNIQFTSVSNAQIKVGVHDLRGRLIYENSYQNNGTVNENISLNNIQTGIYLVTVEDGSRKEVRKIVVE